jgi:mono/diheme cytochrome c family protein
MARKRELPDAVLEAGIVLAALGLAFTAAVAGWGVGRSGRHAPASAVVSTSAATVDPHVAAGAHDFVGFACVQCHGMQGRGGVSPAVPALTTIAAQLTPKQLRKIIDHGLGESKNPTQPYMPVWGEVISTQQVSDLIAYLRAGLPAVPTAEPLPVPTGQGAAVEGATLYVNYGCINCHGPNGLGGVPNPAAPDKTIPPLTGADFHKEFDTAAILAVIRSRSVIGRPPIVSMPHWGGIIPDEQLNALVEFLKTLK